MRGAARPRFNLRQFANFEPLRPRASDSKLQSGSPAPARQGRPRGTGRLAPYESFLVQTVEAKPDITMPELAARLREARGISAAAATLSRLLCRRGFTYKKISDGGGVRTRRYS